MAIDFSPLSRIKSVGDFDQERQARQMNALQLLGAQQKTDEYSRSVADANALRQIQQELAGTAPEAYGQALRQRGRFNEGIAADKAFGEAQQLKVNNSKAAADARGKEIENRRKLFEYGIQTLQTAQNPEQAAAFINGGVNEGHWDMNTASKMIQGMQSDPQGFEMWRRRQLAAITSAKDQLPTFETRNLGGTTDTLRRDPITGQVAVANSAQNTQSPDNAASNARQAADAAAARAQAERHFNTTQGNANLTYDPDRGILVDRKTGNATPVASGGVPIGPKAGASDKLTEDQGKATGWLVQADNAFANMQKALQKNPSAARPGINDAIAAVPSFGVGEALANTMRSPERQQFMQGASSLSEALLRAATGAGVNQDEARQKIRELTPVFGESASTTAQKMAAIPLYIETLKVRAGPGAKQLPAIRERGGAAQQTPGASGGWSIQQVN